ncbi:MAG TPA: hypothetical protein EYQ86_00060, partial [Bacteroidetes bacterium]|nr:hypothetical protein [Bacteroidota bacterium]
MAWNGRAHNGLLISNPLGWIMTHINSNFALFKDNGGRNVRKVLLSLRPGRKMEKFIAVTDRISQFYNASFTLLHVLREDTTDAQALEIEQTANDLLKTSNSESDLIIIRSNKSINNKK